MRRSPATHLSGARALALAFACTVGGCSLLSLDDLQGGASSNGFSASSGSTSADTASSTSAATTESSSASAGGATSGSASASSSSGMGGASPGDAAYVAAILADGPIAWYRLSEGSAGVAAVDQIGMKNGSFDGTGTPFTFGVPSPFMNTTDTAVNFLGGRVTVPHAELAFHDAASSFEAWIDVELVDTNHRGIIDVEWTDGPMDKQGYRMYVYTSFGTPKLVYGRVNADADQDISVNYPNDGEYHHVVGTYDGTTGLCVYIDSAATCTVQTKITLDDAATNVVIGARTFGGTTTAFQGIIDEVTLWDKALTAAQVTAHYQARNAP